MFLCAFRQRNEARLHQILDLHARPAAIRGRLPRPAAPGRRQEAADAVRRSALVGARGGEAAVIIIHAARSSAARPFGSADRAVRRRSPSITSIGCEGGSSEMESTRALRRAQAQQRGHRARVPAAGQ